jgi:hypothetical protein
MILLMITKIKPVPSYTVNHGVGTLNSPSSIGYDQKNCYLVVDMDYSLKNYQTGQIWKYRARDGEAASQIVIINSTSVPGCGEIYSVAVEGVKLKNPWIVGGIQTNLPHAPVSAGCLDLSVLELTGIRPSPLEEYGDAFQEWKRPFDRGEAGVFTISIAEILDYVEAAINHGTIIDSENLPSNSD